MEKLLFQSNGIAKKLQLLILICAVLVFASGVGFIAISQAQHERVGVTDGYMDSDGEYHIVNSGYLGGGDVFTEEGQETLIATGSVLIIVGVLFLLFLVCVRKNRFYIYENHIDSVQFAFWIKFSVRLEYNQISDVQLIKIMGASNLLLISNGTRNSVPIAEDAERAYALIRERIKKDS